MWTWLIHLEPKSGLVLPLVKSWLESWVSSGSGLLSPWSWCDVMSAVCWPLGSTTGLTPIRVRPWWPPWWWWWPWWSPPWPPGPWSRSGMLSPNWEGTEARLSGKMRDEVHCCWNRENGKITSEEKQFHYNDLVVIHAWFSLVRFSFCTKQRYCINAISFL